MIPDMVKILLETDFVIERFLRENSKNSVTLEERLSRRKIHGILQRKDSFRESNSYVKRFFRERFLGEFSKKNITLGKRLFLLKDPY